jgi:hypothetical protein
MEQEIKQAESLIALYQKDRLELYQRISECDKKLAKFNSFIQFMSLIDRDMDFNDAKAAKMILDKYSTLKEAAIKEQSEKIIQKEEAGGWFSWWSSSQAPQQSTAHATQPPSDVTEDFVVVKDKLITIPEIPEAASDEAVVE